MAHNRLTTDNPLAFCIVRSFLDFLDHVDPSPGVDAEGIEVAKECLVEAFRLDYISFAREPVSMIDLFKSIEENKQKQYESSRLDVCPPPDSLKASSSVSDQNAAHAKNHSEASKTKDGDWTQDPHSSEGDLTAVSKEELLGKFLAALEKNHYFKTNVDEGDDQELFENACSLFGDAFTEMERSGSQQFNLKNLAESLKSLGNKAMQSKQYDEAIASYNCAIGSYEKSAVYYCNRAAAYTQVNKYTEAIQDCHKSIEIDPNYSKAYSRLGLAYYAQGNYRDAIDKGFKKALLLDPNNESVKENIRVAELKLLDEQRHTDHNQNSRSSQEFPNQYAQGSRSHAGGVPPTFTSMPFNPNDLASMFMNIAANATNQHQGPHPQERQEDSSSAGTNQPEIRIGGNVSVNLDQIPQELTGAFQSMMEMISGAAPPGQPHGQPHDQMNGGTAPN